LRVQVHHQQAECLLCSGSVVRLTLSLAPLTCSYAQAWKQGCQDATINPLSRTMSSSMHPQASNVLCTSINQLAQIHCLYIQPAPTRALSSFPITTFSRRFPVCRSSATGVSSGATPAAAGHHCIGVVGWGDGGASAAAATMSMGSDWYM